MRLRKDIVVRWKSVGRALVGELSAASTPPLKYHRVQLPSTSAASSGVPIATTFPPPNPPSGPRPIIQSAALITSSLGADHDHRVALIHQRPGGPTMAAARPTAAAGIPSRAAHRTSRFSLTRARCWRWARPRRGRTRLRRTRTASTPAPFLRSRRWCRWREGGGEPSGRVSPGVGDDARSAPGATQRTGR